jgi:imidazolonepropionase-like amidohydrolase
MLIIKGGNVHTMAGKDYFIGDIAIDKGKIVEIGENIAGSQADTVFDAGGKWVMPGIVDAHCHIGMWEDSIGFEGADGNEMTDPCTPHLRAIDGINPADRSFLEARESGVTAVVTGPGSANVIGGQFVAMKTYGRYMDEMIIKAPAALKGAFGENPKRVYNDQKKSPSTRMATAAIMRESLISALDYRKKVQKAKAEAKDEPDRDLKKEAILMVLDKKIPMKVHAHRADDIMTALRIAEEFDIPVTIDHCTEGHLIPDLLREHNARIIIGPHFTERTKVELKNLSFKAPGILHKAGIKFAIMTDHPVIPIQYITVCAALSVREGLDEEEALRAITINAAELTGIADRVGSLEKGKDADIAVFSGNPLDFRTKAEAVFINGVKVV